LNTSRSHLLFTPAGRKRPSVSSKSTNSGASSWPIHTSYSHLPFTPPIHTSYSHPQAARGQTFHSSRSALAHRDVQDAFTPFDSHLLFTPHIHTRRPQEAKRFIQVDRLWRTVMSNSHLLFTAFYSHTPFIPPMHTSRPHPPIHTSYSHLPFTPPIHTRRPQEAKRFIQADRLWRTVMPNSHPPIHTFYSHLPFTPPIHTCRPQEAKRYIQVDRLWRTVMSNSQPPIHTSRSHPPIHTSRSHLFTPAGHKRPSASSKWIVSGAPSCPRRCPSRTCCWPRPRKGCSRHGARPTLSSSLYRRGSTTT